MKLRERLLALVQRCECIDTFWLTAGAFKDSPAGIENGLTDAQIASVHRALSGLAKKGLIVRLGRRFHDGRTRWCTPEFAAKRPDFRGDSDRVRAEESRVGPKRVYTKLGVSASTFRRYRLAASRKGMI
jgi:hypothetical protein